MLQSTSDESVLIKHLEEMHHGLPKIVLQYRHLHKMKSTYIDAIISLVQQLIGMLMLSLAFPRHGRAIYMT